MVEVTLYDGKKIDIPPTLKQFLDIKLSDAMNDEMDVVIVIDGHEGTGKSFMSRGIGKYCATIVGTTLSVDNIHFDTDDYIDSSLAGKRYQVNILDEARNVLGRAKTMNAGVQKFLGYISECRSKRQVHIINLPAYHDLSAYIVLWRTKFIIHNMSRYVKDDSRISGLRLEKGYYKLYDDRKAIEKAYFNHKNKYSYPKNYSEYAKWPYNEVFSPEELKAYNEKKEQYMEKKYGTSGEEEKITRDERMMMRRELLPGLLKAGLSKGTVAGLFGVKEQTINADIRFLKDEGFFDEHFIDGDINDYASDGGVVLGDV